MASGGRDVQRRLAGSVLHVQAYRVLEQFLDHGVVTVADSEVEGCAACGILGEDVWLEA